MNKKNTTKLNTLFILAALAFSIDANAQFTQGNIVVYQVGDGTGTLTNAAAPTFLKEYTTAGVAGISVAMPTAGGARLTNSGSATTEGLITLSSNGQYILIPGYDAATGTANVATTTSASTARVIDTVSFNAIPGRATSTNLAFSAATARGATSDGNNNYWGSGSATGICYLGSGSPAVASSTSTNNRSLHIFNNRLYFSTGAGATHGIFQVGIGAPPTNSGNSSTNVINTGASGSPYQFAMNATSDVCYIADDQGAGVGGIQKWTFSGTWTLAYTLGSGSSSGARGVTVDWSGPNPVIYGTSAEASANRIFTITDMGAGSAATTLATAAANTIFRGITFAPYCTAASIPSITSNDPICTNQTLNLNANVIGANPISYSWSGTGSFSSTTVKNPTVTGAASGIYTLSITNSCGTSTNTVNVVVNNLPNVSASSTASLVCSGNAVTVNGNGATTYTWTNGVTDNVAFNPTSSNTYTVTGTDANNCVNTATLTVNVNSLPVVTATPNPASICIGNSTTLTGGGATTYTWSSGVNDGVAFTPTVTATYTVSGTDANSCVNTATVNVVVNNLPNVSAVPSPTAVCNGSTLTLSGSGATTYTWSSGVNNSVAFTPTVTADYTVTGTDANSCVNTATVNVVVNNLPNVSASSTASVICLGDAVTVNGSGATTYTWSNGVNDNVAFNPTSNNTYTVTGTDANNCTNTATVTVNVNSLPIVTATPSPSVVCIGSNLILTGGGAVTYTWSSGVSNGVAFTPTVTADYTVTGTDANNCVNTTTVNVAVNNLPNVSAVPSATAVCNGSTLTLSGSGATTYTWSSGVNDGIAFTPTVTADYTVTGTDANNCINTATVNVVVNNLPIILANYTPNDTICIGDPVTLTGGGAATYTWTGGVNDGVAFSPSVTVTYTVSGTDANNCTDTASVEIVVNSCTTGLHSLSQTEINIYPNPAKDVLNIRSENIVSSVKITNVLGETVYATQVNATEMQINLSELQTGNYFVRLTSDKGMVIKKITIQK